MMLLAAILALNLVTTLSAVNPYDPGACTKRKRGKFVVIRDRNDDDKIVACVRSGGKYQWDMINGNSYGNYFDPAEDCSHVVDNVPEPESGVYWIQTKKGPIKAWCDVDTDKGGFLLIGVKDTPETWAIPSGASFIHPHGSAGWSSVFGDKNVLDFRVQISTSKDFHDTRADWYYRFNSPRVLSKLLMSNKGGCGHQYPGIGNIAFVKDLMSRKIATRNFDCSRFSASIAPGLGWDKMNQCFKKACRIGFAYLYKYHVDTSGSYSYSVVNGRSGIQDTQTSFIGCDHGKCCACFGPDSKQDYCAPKCQAINGGTVLKEKDNITVWFWIRSSLPKRVWKQCMEFKEKNSAGKWEIWRVENGVRRKGSCSVSEDVTINDGVTVVANNQSMNELPKVEGLLSYRSDDRKLYLKEKSRWKALATQKDIKDVLDELKRVDEKLTNSDKATLEKVNRNLINTNQTFLDKLQKLDKKLTNTDKATLNEVKKNLINNNRTILDKLQKLDKKITNVQTATLDRLEQVEKNITKTKTEIRLSSISGCHGGGWTLVMKIDGSSSTFRYDSSYWASKSTYNDNSYGRDGGLDNRQFKGSTYWRTSFKEICVGTKYKGNLKAFSFSYRASSLYDLIADGKYRQTHLGRNKWKSLISGSSLQYNCNREGFNVHAGSTKVRLGIISNNQNNCDTPNSFIGLGVYFSGSSSNSAGNAADCCSPDNGNKDLKVMGYILVR